MFANWYDCACLSTFLAFALLGGVANLIAHGEALEPVVGDRVTMKVNLLTVAAFNEAITVF
jgi:hypothetical protein